MNGGGGLQSASPICLPMICVCRDGLVFPIHRTRRLVSSGMVVTPVPIVALLLLVQLVELAVLVVSLAYPNTVRAYLSVVPGMIIRVIFVVISHVFGASTCQKRRKHCRTQYQGPHISLYSEHFAILLR